LNKVETNLAPKAIGFYSQGIKTENLIFTSGQIPIDPNSGKLIVDDFKKEVEQVLENIDAILIAGGSSINRVVKLTVYLTDLSLFDELNEVFKKYFNDNKPARSTIQVSALPLNSRIEVDAIGSRK
tara:strand:+ start:4961 stop:5338 length:378 start_codon:yes stop_codon:yes gene_type:complete